MNRGMRSSYRLKVRNTFSRFTNTADDRLCPDMDTEEDIVCEDVAVETKRKRVETSGKPRSLNKIFEENVSRANPESKLKESKKVGRSINDGSIAKGVQPSTECSQKTKSNNESEPSSTVKGILRKLKRMNTRKDFDDSAQVEGAKSTPSRVSRSSQKKVYIIGEEDDDDDFVEPVFVREGPLRSPFKRAKRKAGSNVRKEPHIRQPEGHVNGIRTRTSPKPLCRLMNQLTLSQAVAVEEMGLGCLLDMSVDGIPEKIGYFVVDHLNTEMMELHFGGNTIQITPDTVAEILGLPNVGIDLSVQNTDSRNKIVFTSWRKKYEGKKIRPTDLVEDIKKSGLADDDFKVNFMLLFVSVMGECSPQGCCLMSIMQKFSSIDMITSVNWAKYIFDCLRRSKRTWRPNTYESYYTGPITFLTLPYVTRTVALNVTVDQDAPPLCVWTMQTLRARQNAIGGLDVAPLRFQPDRQVIAVETVSPLHVETNDSDMALTVCHPDCTLRTDTDVNMTDANGTEENIENMGYDDAYNEPDSGENEEESEEESDSDEFDMDMNQLMKEYIIMIENKFATIHEARWDLEELIELAQQFFPYEVVFKNYDKSKRSIFRDCQSEDSKDSDEHQSESDDDVETNDISNPTFVTPQKESADNCESSQQRSPLSPIWLTQTTYNILDEALQQKGVVTPMAVDTENPDQQNEEKGTDVHQGCDNDVDVIPSYNIDFSPIRSCALPKPSVAAKKPNEDTEKVQTNRRRPTKVGTQLHSPFVRRQVLVGVSVKPQETRVHELCLAAFGGPDDVMYKLVNGQELIRTTMETLAADEHIYANVIDGWVDVLNMEEKYRSPASPHRYFFTPSALVGGVLMRYTYGFKQRYEIFRNNLLSEAKGNDDVFNVRSFDMVFFPILQGRHYFCVVFNFKSNTVDILDNIERNVNVDAYDNAITDLKQLFVYHLKEVQHPSAEMLKHVDIRLLEMKWRTKENYIDCGVFLMRHMETYMGGGLRGWFTGLTTESEAQKKQLQMLRIKYTAKILLGEYNLSKKDIVEQMEELKKLGDEAKENMIKQAAETRSKRLEMY